MTNTYVQDQIAKVDVQEVLDKHTGEVLDKAEIVNKPIQSLKNIAGALAKAQLEMKNPTLDKENPFFHSKYASLAAVRDASIPILAKHGIATMQLLSNAQNGDIVCTTTLLHTSGEYITSDLVLPATKKDAQGLGSASTYARRYALQAIVGIVGEDDDDGNESTKKQEPAQEAQKHKQELSKVINGESPMPYGGQPVVGIKSVTSKAGNTNGKAWTKYFITTSENETLPTFDKKIAEFAEKAKAEDFGVIISKETKGKYTNIVGMERMPEPDFSDPALSEEDISEIPY